eukprot:4257593-Pyramimonas_sp.AAC.1
MRKIESCRSRASDKIHPTFVREPPCANHSSQHPSLRTLQLPLLLRCERPCATAMRHAWRNRCLKQPHAVLQFDAPVAERELVFCECCPAISNSILQFRLMVRINGKLTSQILLGLTVLKHPHIVSTTS